MNDCDDGRGRAARRMAPSGSCWRDPPGSSVRRRGGHLKRSIRILRGERGQDTVEYALLAAFIALVVMSALLYLRPNIVKAYAAIHKAFDSAPVGSGDRGGGTPNDG